MFRTSHNSALAVVGVDLAADRVLVMEAPGRPRRASVIRRMADVGRPGSTSPMTPQSNQSGAGSSPGQPANQSTSNDSDLKAQEPAHSSGGLSGSEEEVDLVSFPDDPSDPEEPASEPLGDEKKAIVIYAARNLTNTVDARPTGHGWFSA